ncbi:50S ribosomal protein L4 [Candidatus Dojkabacteria bacterium]|uniref:Large ribosomal subunit protein uL4 n=1 Tax=Candidatus Dojkabacteria bacterium TaxID=2099670 RepID=A0A5C7JDK9_9BACT|nr:MAG: 50S ribosomal protein L4 [Candidatus Dojkabacteria bacterium]
MAASKTTKKAEIKAPKAVKAEKVLSAASGQVKSTAKVGNLSAVMYDTKGASAGTFSLPKEVFGAKINNVLMAQAVRVYLANQRQGNAHTKSRGEITLTTAKWYRQKGTGRARHGAQSAPIFVGGGVAHGPKAHDFTLSLPKKMRRAALISALSQKAKDGEITILSGFEKVEPKTKAMSEVIAKITADKKRKSKILVIASNTPKNMPNIYRAGRNIKNVDIISADLLNTYEVLKHKNLLVMKESIEVLSGGVK